MGKSDMKISIINIGSGYNPMECAKNIDPDASKPVDEIGTAEKLSAPNSTVDVVLMISPWGYFPLESDAARVLKPGGLLVVIGNERNNFFAEVYNAQETVLNRYGFERKGRGDAHRKLRNSQTTNGHPIAPNRLKQIVLRRREDV